MFPVSLQKIIDAVIEVWPEHEKFVRRGVGALEESEMYAVERIAESVLPVVDEELGDFASAYREMCKNISAEELYFRRNDSYRYSTYDEVADFVYHNEPYMRTYMRGLLLSQVLWTNHVGVMSFYVDSFLSKYANNASRGLEVGPGHGLFMHMWLEQNTGSHCEGWDISQSSLQEARNSLEKLGHPVSSIQLHERNANELSSIDTPFDAITISEVLEHTEDPQSILNNLTQGLAENGVAFINVPLNCPAIDHIYLYRESSDIVAQVEQAGMEVLELVEVPVTGYTLERAKRMKVTISTALIARKVSA